MEKDVIRINESVLQGTIYSVHPKLVRQNIPEYNSSFVDESEGDEEEIEEYEGLEKLT